MFEFDFILNGNRGWCRSYVHLGSYVTITFVSLDFFIYSTHFLFFFQIVCICLSQVASTLYMGIILFYWCSITLMIMPWETNYREKPLNFLKWKVKQE